MLPSIFGENLFDEFFDAPFSMMRAWDRQNPAYHKSAGSLMKTDVRETKNSYELDIDLPGFKKEDVQLQLNNGYLTISASTNTNNDQKDKEGRYIRQERYVGQCSRSFYVGDRMEKQDVSARFEDGILKISLPKQTRKELPANNNIIDIQ